MAGHKKEGLTPRQRPPFECGFADFRRCEPTSNGKSVQLDALNRLGLFRSKLDVWRAGGCAGPMPTPNQFGLRLGLSSSEVYWRAAT